MYLPTFKYNTYCFVNTQAYNLFKLCLVCATLNDIHNNTECYWVLF
jgi:hypothetical protein